MRDASDSPARFLSTIVTLSWYVPACTSIRHGPDAGNESNCGLQRGVRFVARSVNHQAAFCRRGPAGKHYGNERYGSPHAPLHPTPRPGTIRTSLDGCIVPLPIIHDRFTGLLAVRDAHADHAAAGGSHYVLGLEMNLDETSVTLVISRPLGPDQHT